MPLQKQSALALDGETVQKAVERYGPLLDAAPDAMLISDRRGVIVLANKQLEALFGYASGELVGRPVEVLVPMRVRDLHVRHRDGYTADPHLRPMGVGMELYGVRRDGTEVPIEVSLSPVRLEDGLLVISAIRNLSTRKKAEEAMAHLAAIVRASSDAIIGKDLEGVIVSWNPAAEKLFGYPAESALGRNASFLAPPEGVEEMRRILDRVGRGEGIESYESVRARKDGSLLDVSVTVSPIRTPNGKIVGTSTIARDITVAKRAQRELHLMQSIALAMNEAERVEDAVTIALREICRTIGWPFGQAWLPHPDGDHMAAGPAWSSNAARFSVFRKVSEDMTFVRDAGVVGRVWASREPLWVPDVLREASFKRQEGARAAGL
ncbi:MAG: PAS domain S-box protein, partial [Planctomycetes bacterium]|nr:PAS domain S-box protein [Planctomycetota bacterium]